MNAPAATASASSTRGLAMGPRERAVRRRPKATSTDAGNARSTRATTSPTARGAPTAFSAGPIWAEGSHEPGSG